MTIDTGVPAASATLRILSYLAAQSRPVPAATLASSLSLPRSSVYKLLGVLVDAGFVLHVAETRRYGLGIAAFELGSGFARQEPLARLGHPVLALLVDRIAESAHLAVPHGRDVLYLIEERAPRRPALVSDVGVRLPAHLTASGLAMLASMPAAQVRALFPDEKAFARRGNVRGPRSYAQLRRVLTQTRARGFAIEDETITPGIASIAVSVIDHAAWPAAAIAVTFDRASRDPADWNELADQTRRYARELSRRIGGHPASE
ncbi:IclR family transcriptional regulator [Agreia sp. VKM Ac-1783]|uniref:IclR family transcriptional regulator n=1 Tax=Agreia sp. VKM Ac-1783 TaxID=1938889 RepID=UPI000A2AE0DB|nr:IclR family transcriptional regulator [Agreia sp. VKM Ac-1783]SMQ68466.1 transcriptional regulator, IclR family [Agreia sp. VKM Ac-1783]